MKRTIQVLIATLLAFCPLAFGAKISRPPDNPTPGDLMLADYFRNETAAIAERCLADIKTLDDWKAKRDEYRRQLQEMLGLWPMPGRTDLKPVITGKLEQDDFTVEKLHFQASPQLYVTANLYLPRKLAKPAPAILYVCGHSRMITNGVSLGNKTGYQHHGAWFARNGYVCLMIDTLQFGEIQGVHRGTYSERMWWWNSRGYTPAGVEAWFGIRALDYLCSRPEVDRERIGMTGRSGGGSYSWTVAALDDRVKVVCPVAGITDLQNHVVDGCVEGHCDCMFFLNTYRWDFPLVAALIAPRPMLIGNSDKDRIFPLDGVLRIHEQARRIYGLYGAQDKLGLLITEGPHEDTQDLQVPVFRWFNRFLKGEQPLIEMAAKKLLEPAQLRVFDQLPADAVNTNIQAIFVPRGNPTLSEVRERRESLIATLKEKTFGGWPAEDTPLEVKPGFSAEHDGVKFSAWDFLSQHDVRLRLFLLESGRLRSGKMTILMNVFDEEEWNSWLAVLRTGFEPQLRKELEGRQTPKLDAAGFDNLKHQLETGQISSMLESLRRHLGPYPVAMACFAPRGIGSTAISTNAAKRVQLRRRFMLLGQTLDGMRVWDIRRAVQTLRFVRAADTTTVNIVATGPMGVNAGYASVFEPGIRVITKNPVRSETDEPDYLNVYRFLDSQRVMQLVPGAKKVD